MCETFWTARVAEKRPGGRWKNRRKAKPVVWPNSCLTVRDCCWPWELPYTQVDTITKDVSFRKGAELLTTVKSNEVAWWLWKERSFLKYSWCYKPKEKPGNPRGHIPKTARMSSTLTRLCLLWILPSINLHPSTLQFSFHNKQVDAVKKLSLSQ